MKKISLPEYLYITTNIHGEELCDFFYSDIIEELTIWSDLKNITYSIVYMVMYKIMQRNLQLLEQKCIDYKLYPTEVAIGILGVSYHGEDINWMNYWSQMYFIFISKIRLGLLKI